MAARPEKRSIAQQMLWVNKGHSQISVCNGLLLLSVDAHDSERFLLESRLLYIPVDRWHEYGEDISKMRSTGWVLPHWFNRDLSLKLRRLGSLAGRNTEEADWEEQAQKFNGRWRPVRRALGPKGWRREYYEQLKIKRLKEIGFRMAKLMETKPQTAREWWQRRWYNTPGGSSSMSKERVRLAHPELNLKQFEVDKKNAMELYTYDEFVQWVSEPAYILARCSTKHEPGFKNRPLQAGNDEHSAISSYVSDGIEHNYSHDGVVISQKPKDVAEWFGIQLTNAERYHISYDFDAYNMQNHNTDMYLLNYYSAEALLQKPDEDWKLDKAICALWLAESNLAQFISVHGETQRTINGLYSGSRNTARDNSLLHEVYQEVILHSLELMTGMPYSRSSTRKSGDDETAVVNTLLEAILYVRVVEKTGFLGKRSKLMIAKGNSEFLQLALDSTRKPVYPVAPVIATFVSGNWYKQPVRDLPAVVPALRDQIWNMVREGMDINMGRQLLYRSADWFMAAPDENGKMMYFDWKYYLKSEDSHPLTLNEGGNQVFPEIHVEKEYKFGEAHATQDSLTAENEWWELMDREGEKVEKSNRQKESFARAIRKDLDQEYCREATRVLRPRKGPTIPHKRENWDTSVKWSILLKKMAGGIGERNKPSFEEICARHKLPTALIKRVEHEEKFDRLPAKIRSDLRAATEGQRRKTKPEDYNLPPPLIAVW
uniref:RNA-directed RNA polymerase n=1 Tax=Erysiphales associated totivirus 24 TaxID=2719854 RepID=A0A6G9ENN1_9VIRU|nr:RNA-dependent RNA polymerase [Erysiphales associated totivirus 24]